MKIEVSNGELLDKFSILLIKNKKIINKDKLSNINKELDELRPLCNLLLVNELISSLFAELSEINSKLWVVEDDLRLLEKQNKFNIEFVNLARSVYILNDERARVKKEINIHTNSLLIEEKSYESY